jgi:hypothetical protein
LKTERRCLPKHIISEEVIAAGTNAGTARTGRNTNKVTPKLKMSYVLKYLPELEQLKQELEDPNLRKFYNKYEGYVGSSESIEYLHKMLGVDPEPDNSYIKKRFVG